MIARECLWLGEQGIEAERLRPNDVPFPLWLVRLRHPPSPYLIQLLSSEEQERADRFRTSQLHDRYIAAHAGLRLLIQNQFGLPADYQQFASDPLGRPQLMHNTNIRFSISYSGRNALIGLSREREIGVDLEAVRPIDDALALADMHYTSRERSALERAVRMGKSSNNGFLRTWVRKEACVKALGLGLTVPLDKMHCGMGSKTTTVNFRNRSIFTGVVHACDLIIISSPSDLIIGWARL